MSGVFENAWRATKLPGHPFETPYRNLVERMLGNLLPVLLKTSQATPLTITIEGREVVVSSDFVKGDAGSRSFVAVRPGKRSTTEADKISHTLLLEAARANFGSSYSFETFHVIEGTAGVIDQTTAKRGKRMETAREVLRSMVSGHFPAIQSDFQCPRCRHFFICPAPHNRD